MTTDDVTAYGCEWTPSGSLRLSARNSGLFYVRATEETLIASDDL